MDFSFTEYITSLSPLEIVLIACFILLFITRMVFELMMLTNLILKKEKAQSPDDSTISIIMAIRNEANNLTKNLPTILNLNDSNYEVIVVDDFSQDQSLTILGLLKKSNPKLKLSSLNQDARFSTKLAQNIAIKASSGKWALMFSPSIKIKGDNWLSSFRNQISKETEIVIGYSSIQPQKGFFNLLYRIELFLQQLNSYISTKMGMSYVTNELNVLFTSKKYFDQGGFKGVMSEEYANMEFIINKFISKKNTEILFSEKGKIVRAVDVNKEYFVELKTKLKHIKKRLSFSKRAFITFNNGTKLLLPVFFVLIVLLSSQLLILSAVLVGIKMIIHILIVFSALKRLNEQKIFIPSLLYELFEPYYVLVSRILKRLTFRRK